MNEEFRELKKEIIKLKSLNRRASEIAGLRRVELISLRHKTEVKNER